MAKLGKGVQIYIILSGILLNAKLSVNKWPILSSAIESVSNFEDNWAAVTSPIRTRCNLGRPYPAPPASWRSTPERALPAAAPEWKPVSEGSTPERVEPAAETEWRPVSESWKRVRAARAEAATCNVAVRR